MKTKKGSFVSCSLNPLSFVTITGLEVTKLYFSATKDYQVHHEVKNLLVVSTQLLYCDSRMLICSIPLLKH